MTAGASLPPIVTDARWQRDLTPAEFKRALDRHGFRLVLMWVEIGTDRSMMWVEIGTDRSIGVVYRPNGRGGHRIDRRRTLARAIRAKEAQP